MAGDADMTACGKGADTVEAASAERKMLLQKADHVQAHASAQQHKAADPKLSVFVNANAGSGKTYLLVNRVIRLLLDGARPESILCLTYTKAAATEMRSRLFDRLAEWIHLDDGELLERIRGDRHLNHANFRDDQLPLARRLFTMALETPGGLKVQTIHAFCERLLQAFPVEAGMPPGFEVMDETQTRALLEEAKARLLVAEGGESAVLREWLALLATLNSEERMHKLLGALLRHRQLLARMRRSDEVHDAVMKALRVAVGIGEKEPEDEQTWLAAWFEQLPRRALEQCLQQLASLPERILRDTDRKTCAALREMLRANDAAAAADIAMRLFLKADGELRHERRWLLTSKVRDAAPQAVAVLKQQEHAIWRLRQGLLARRMLAANVALLQVGQAILDLYEQEKARQGRFDYDDLILRTLALLDGDRGAWVLYRLDGGIEHLLLDEAQDTSPEQWEILLRLTEEFTAGSGAERPGRVAHAGRRTVFAVGDVKQSIYSFQGAAPEAFHQVRDFFRERHAQAGLEFDAVPLGVSFRTVQEILEVVDTVLGLDGFRLGEDDLTPHESARPHVRGFVELWPLEEGGEADDVDDEAAGVDGGEEDETTRAVRQLWQVPVSLEADMRPRLRLAARIADTIRRWLDEGEALPPDERQGQDGPRRIQPKDILILVRNRTTLMDAIVSALKQRGIAVAGVDRLKVVDHIAVQDMLALVRFLLLPADDLSLAAVLKSPLAEKDDGTPFDDDDLLRLRGELFDFSAPLENIVQVHEERPLWRQLQAAAEAGAPVRQVVVRLRQWRKMAGQVPPWELLAHVLWRDGGVRRFVARLGEEALEPLEALLDLAQRFEREEAASLSAFVEWLQHEAPEIKRELEGAESTADDAGAVSVMTVHGAKGLEAPVVFLADTTDVPTEKHLDLIELALPQGQAGAQLPLWPMRGADRPAMVRELVEAHKRGVEEEYNRLLYVAMTRAADRLYVCGAKSRHGKGGNGADDGEGGSGASASKPRIRSWYEWLSDVLCKDEFAVPLEDGRTVWRFPREVEEYRCEQVPQPAEPVPLPDWAMQDALEEPGPAEWLSPSRLGDGGKGEGARAAEPVLSPLELVQRRDETLPDALRRGVFIHKLLQYLLEVEAERRAPLAVEWLMQPGQGLDETRAQALWVEVERVLAEPEAQALFGPHSRAEVPFAARLPGAGNGAGMLVSGQIDRLAVLEQEVIVADFKTARPLPRGVQDVPDSHVRQLALYRHAAARIWPDKAVRGVLIYTAGPLLLKLPEEMLEAALPG